MNRAWTLAAALASACGGAPPVEAVSGEYVGPNELDFLVTAPVQRQMPLERHQGSAVVAEDSGTRLTLDLRMLADGESCRVVAVRSAPGAETLSVEPGQRCASRFVYEGDPVAAVVQINEGTVTLSGETIQVRLGGAFVADVAEEGGGRSEIEGIVRWSLDGQR